MWAARGRAHMFAASGSCRSRPPRRRRCRAERGPPHSDIVQVTVGRIWTPLEHARSPPRRAPRRRAPPFSCQKYAPRRSRPPRRRRCRAERGPLHRATGHVDCEKVRNVEMWVHVGEMSSSLMHQGRGHLSHMYPHLHVSHFFAIHMSRGAVQGASFRAAAAAPRRAGPAGRVFLARERWGAAAGSAPRGGAGVFEGRPNSSNCNLNNVAVRGASFRAAAAAPRRAGPATPRGREHVGTPARRPHLPEAANMWARPRATHISPTARGLGVNSQAGR